MASRSSTTLEELQKEVSSWEAAYDKAPKTSGPTKWRLHADFMHSTYNNIVAGVVQRQEQAAKAERAQAAERQRSFEQRLQQVPSLSLLHSCMPKELSQIGVEQIQRNLSKGHACHRRGINKLTMHSEICGCNSDLYAA